MSKDKAIAIVERIDLLIKFNISRMKTGATTYSIKSDSKFIYELKQNLIKDLSDE